MAGAVDKDELVALVADCRLRLRLRLTLAKTLSQWSAKRRGLLPLPQG